MKVSIITIVYNNVATIEKCINSILNQTYPEIEYVVIDGGSTDGTCQILERYNNKIDVFLSERDNGLYDALNKGIALATGDIIGILHSDDLFYNDMIIQKVVNEFKSSGSDLVYGNGIYVARQNTRQVKRVYSSTPFRKWFLYFGWIPLHTTIFVKREVFEKFGTYDSSYSISGDYDISLRWFKNDKIKKYFLNEFVVRMRLGGKSTSRSLQRRKSSEDIDIIKKHNLWGWLTLFFKIGRKIPQYIKPFLKSY